LVANSRKKDQKGAKGRKKFCELPLLITESPQTRDGCPERKKKALKRGTKTQKGKPWNCETFNLLGSGIRHDRPGRQKLKNRKT